MTRPWLAMGLLSLVLTSCKTPTADVVVSPVPTVTLPEPPLPGLPASLAEAPPESPRLPGDLADLEQRIDDWFAKSAQRTSYVQTDKPLYRPGETIWIRTFDLNVKDFTGRRGTRGIQYALVGPKGDVVVDKRLVRQSRGDATNDLVIPAGASGGRYTVRATGPEGVVGEKEIVVQAYDPPRIKKHLEFVRDAYGAGDEVVATVAIARTTGEPLANHPVTGVVTVDGQTLPAVQASTDAAGDVAVRFTLPSSLEIGDGLLTVLVDDGGITESVSRRIPIVTQGLRLTAYPEGGDLVLGQPGRVYFEALDRTGRPADVEGRVVDDTGHLVTRFRSIKDGLGRFDLTPEPGRAYHIEIVQPVGIAEQYPVPEALADGCTLTSFDDFDSSKEAIRVAVRCSRAQDVVVVASLREQRLDTARVHVPAGDAATVWLSGGGLVRKQGVARITVFDADLQPLAERVIFRNRTRGLSVAVKADREHYGPRDTVVLAITTKDAEGQPVDADLALSVVDDTVVKFADDRKGQILSKLLLEPEMDGEIEEPNAYFDPDADEAGAAMDLLMGTRGWRRFEWAPVTGGTRTTTEVLARAGTAVTLDALPDPEHLLASKQGPPIQPVPEEKPQAEPKDAKSPDMPAAASAPAAPPRPEPGTTKDAGETPVADLQKNESRRAARRDHHADEALVDIGAIAPPPVAIPELQPLPQPAAPEPPPQLVIAATPPAARAPMMGRNGWDGHRGGSGMAYKPARPAIEWAKVRRFPVPHAAPAWDGPRTDFRDTVYFAPVVHTGEDGTAEVRFTLSDAVTSFRVTTEGVGDGLVGRDETVIASKRPFSLDVKLPGEVTLGDRIDLPVLLANESSQALAVALSADLPKQLRATRGLEGSIGLDAGEHDARYLALDVVGQRGKGAVRLMAHAKGLDDEIVREIAVSPPGFPASASHGGRLADRETFSVDLSEDTIDGTVESSLSLYPSFLDTLADSFAGMVNTPGGCFEQTTSSNYPNVLILTLAEKEGGSPGVVAHARSLLSVGYQRLAGYESASGGFEWFGADPGHEGLTAMGLLQFTDTARVYDGVDKQMMARTSTWLKSRRTGEGTYQINPRYLHSWNGDADVASDYITWALVRSGRSSGIDEEIARMKKVGGSTDDPYRLALAADTLAHTGGAGKAIARLAAMQDDDGGFAATGQSVTQSRGRDLRIETTAIATMAFLTAGDGEHAQRGVDFLLASRLADGRFGNTQATVLALRALVAVHDSGTLAKPGVVHVIVDGEPVGDLTYGRGATKPELELDRWLGAGHHTVELVHEGEQPIPYALAANWRRVQPPSDPEAPIDLETSLASAEVGMGGVVRLAAVVTNRTGETQPMTIARIGLPGGLGVQTWQLDDLVKRGVVDFWETRGREVDLYWREMSPNQVATVPIDLVANVPGKYTAPASSAYLYYTEESKDWADPIAVAINR